MSSVRSPQWWTRALTLSERARLPRGTECSAVDDTAAVETSPGPLARWRRQRPFDRPEFLTRRLRLDALTEQEFEALVSAPPDFGAAGDQAPAWVAAIDRASALAEEVARFRETAPVGPPDGIEVARAFVEPFITVAMSRLFARARSIAAASAAAPFDPEMASRLFEPALWGQLSSRSMKVVILELNVARIEGTLVGETPEERCADFARQLRAGPTRERVIAEYPVLARVLVTTADYWEQSAAEFLEHLAADASVLSDALFGGNDVGHLVAVAPGAGDGHRHGRSVIIAELSSGARVVYKPRPLDVDAHFAQLVEWVNARGLTPALRAVRTISRGDHGWSEFMPNTSCASEDQVVRFYERFGAFLAILHALEATDFHYENVIASGEHPALIDLEALFHPRAGADDRRGEPEWLGWSALQHSVLRAGVLPFRTGGSEASSGMDLSAVGGHGGQQSPNRFPVLVGAGTDGMHFARDHVRLPDTKNRPSLGGQSIDPTRFVDRVAAGFTSAYRLLMEHREALLAPDGPIHCFAADPIRVVLRPTRQYALLLSESHHPDVLRDAVERDRLIDRLWVAVPARPDLERIIACEHADLVNGDVPLFTTRPRSRDLFTTHGTVIPEFFRFSGLESAIDRIRSLSEADLLHQQWVVQASLVALVPGRHGSNDEGPEHPPRPATRPGEPSPRRADRLRPPAEAECLDAARLVASRLATLALRDEQNTCWLGLTLVRDRDWVIQPIAADLYGGTLGIALFLAYLDELVADDASKQIARAVVTQVVRRVGSLLDTVRADIALPAGSIGAFGTLGGAAYALAHIGVLWNDRALLETADRVLATLTPHVATDRHLDIIGGTAGFAMAAAALHHALPGGSAHEALRASVAALTAAAEVVPGGVAWTTALRATQPLTGMSHGASGMALALATAGGILGSQSAADLARDAVRYERSTVDLDRGNWPDYRVLDHQPAATTRSFMWAWCHGAPGVGLARLAVASTVVSPEVRADLDLALQSTAALGFGSNDSLCHGDLGNLELLLRAWELGHRGPWERRLASESTRLVERLSRGEWRCGIPGGVETPGLMMGLAGIGYGLLRLGAPSRVPSVLSLEAPRSGIVPRSDR